MNATEYKIRNNCVISGWLVLTCSALIACSLQLRGAELNYDVSARPEVDRWPDRFFRRDHTELALSIGPGFGMPILGSRLHHNWVIGLVNYGWMLSDVGAERHWYRGNWEITADLFGGFQYHPNHAYVIGAGPGLRYNFVTGTRWVPFFSIGVGLTATDIRSGDLSTDFEFNLRAGPGLRYFFNERLAATFQYQFIHLSNAGLSDPNLGVNNSTLLLGVNWFF